MNFTVISIVSQYNLSAKFVDFSMKRSVEIVVNLQVLFEKLLEDSALI